jgi:hypothetical protein
MRDRQWSTELIILLLTVYLSGDELGSLNSFHGERNKVVI